MGIHVTLITELAITKTITYEKRSRAQRNAFVLFLLLFFKGPSDSVCFFC